MRPEAEPQKWAEWRATPEAFHQELVDSFLQLKPDQVAALCRELLPMLSTPELQRNFLENLTGAVNMSLDQGDLEGAARLLEVAETITESVDNDWGRTECHYWRGQLETRRGRPEEAIPHFQEAMEGTEEPDKRLKAMHSLAMAHFFAGNLDKAERQFQATIDVAQAHSDNPGLAHSYLGLAQVAQGRNQMPEAAAWLEKARQAAENAAAPHLVARILGEQGLLYAQAQDLDAARVRYQESEEYLTATPAEMPPDEQIRATVALAANKAALALRKGDLEAARGIAEQALMEQSALPPLEQVDNLVAVGNIEMMTGNARAAKQHLLTAFRLAERSNYPKGRLEAGLGLCSVYALQGYCEPAHRVCAAAIEGLERIRSQVGGEFERLGYVQDKMQAYELMVRLSLILGDLKGSAHYQCQAVTYVERAKSRTLIEALGPTTPLTPPSRLPAELHQAEAKLLAELRRLETEVRMSKEEEIERVYHEKQEELDALWREINEIAPEYAALRRGVPVTFDEVCALLEV